ncbi:hypothetical protein BRD00_08575 [Halobacteriales archaeon QS_8_69_26]|nr:MAG: hypothetical protein BRD00_08575 [Halobacteriales archaeon QS_8_69_26]
MDRTTLAGIVLTVGGPGRLRHGIAGDVGLVPVIEGRAFSVTGVMIGIKRSAGSEPLTPGPPRVRP